MVIQAFLATKIANRRNVLQEQPVPSPRASLVGSSPPNNAPAPPNWNMKQYKSVEFCQFLKCQAPPAQM